MVQLMPLHPKTASSIAPFKSRLVLPFWYRLTQVFLEKSPLNGYISEEIDASVRCVNHYALYLVYNVIINKNKYSAIWYM